MSEELQASSSGSERQHAASVSGGVIRKIWRRENSAGISGVACIESKVKHVAAWHLAEAWRAATILAIASRRRRGAAKNMRLCGMAGGKQRNSI
jgi:hypothetical protein